MTQLSKRLAQRPGSRIGAGCLRFVAPRGNRFRAALDGRPSLAPRISFPTLADEAACGEFEAGTLAPWICERDFPNH